MLPREVCHARRFACFYREQLTKGECVMNMRTPVAALAAMGLGLVGFAYAQSSKDTPVVPPLTSVPTFSTANIARQGHFYVGGKWVGQPGQEVMRGAMYVETWVPKNIKYKYPIVFVQGGGGQTNVAML